MSALTRSITDIRNPSGAGKRKTGLGIAFLRILGCVITPPLVAAAVIFISSDPNLRAAYLEEFSGFNRSLIAAHLPTASAPASKQAAAGNPTGRGWSSVHPRFAEFSAQEQVSRIESLLAQERSGVPTPALYELRKATAFPAAGQLEVRTLSRQRWYMLIAGSSVTVFLLIQCLISMLAWWYKGSRRRRPSSEEESLIGTMSYSRTKAYERRS